MCLTCKVTRRKVTPTASTTHIQLGKDLCPDTYTGEDVSMFKDWRLKVSNYLSSDDDDTTNEILEWAGNQNETITHRDG